MPWLTERLYPDDIDQDNAVRSMVLRTHLERYQKAKDWLKEHFDGRSIRTLDIACGSGYGCEMLSELGDVVGADMDPEVVEYAIEKYGRKGTTFEVANADDVDSLRKLGKFDAIVSIATLEHVADARSYLGWVRETLLPGGVAVLGFPSCLTLDWAKPHHKRDISRNKARSLFEQSGLGIRKEYYQENRVPMKNLILEKNTIQAFPVPPLRQWVFYYLLHPHHFLFRIYELFLYGGFMYSHQQYLTVPSG